MKKLNEYTIIGKIINTKGIKGELKILPLTSSVDRFSDLKTVFVGEDLENYTISKVSYDAKFAYIKFVEFNDINEVLKFKEQFLYVKDSDRIKLDEGTYFISDIIGCEVFNTDNEFLGKIEDVLENPVNDLYVLKNENGQYLIPAVKQFIKKVDVINKTIIIDPIEGLIS